MVFVDKSLEVMLEEIEHDDINGEVTTRTDSDDECFDNLIDGNKGYRSLVRRFVPDRRDREILLDDPSFDTPTQPVIEFLVGNAYIHGYGWKPGGEIRLSYYFGTKGVVFRVSDDGDGFDSEELIKAAKNGDIERWKHFMNTGAGTRFLMLPHYEATIESSQVEPTGTTVTVMFRYGQNITLID